MKKLLKYIAYFFGILILILLAFIGYMMIVSNIQPPKVTEKDRVYEKLQRKQIDSNCYTIGNNWIRKSKSGIWEMYVEGNPYERGVINGKLAKELVQKQEEAFVDQIARLIPSRSYQHFLKYLIGFFNKDLPKNLTEEEKLEIYGVSQAASHEFDFIGTPYQRILNYHGAHDIGHALQNFALVGCSSFSTWNDRSQDSTLISGRNFDFYVGDKFAEDKLLMFCNPTKGYKFMIVTWGGFTGVVSGMNLEGLSITLNASKSSIPTGTAEPVSLIAREILQYAKNIDEAVKIAKSRKAFVSESFMISSAADNKTVIIEKTPDITAVAYPENNEIICTNHYQSKELLNSEKNTEQIKQSASEYRYERIKELLEKTEKNTPEKTVAILRNQLGLHDQFIGYGNEKAVNQLICHHSIVFEPKKKLVWISTQPWQLGEYVAYDLNKVFAMRGLSTNREIADTALNIKSDEFLKTADYKAFVAFRTTKEKILNKQTIDVAAFIKTNPEFYDTYVLAGNYSFDKKLYAQAKKYYQTALTKEVATKYEIENIQDKIKKCDKKLN
ncbi:MAG: C45 family peptidase [Chitinophagales bacterium]